MLTKQQQKKNLTRKKLQGKQGERRDCRSFLASRLVLYKSMSYLHKNKKAEIELRKQMIDTYTRLMDTRVPAAYRAALKRVVLDLKSGYPVEKIPARLQSLIKQQQAD